MRVAFLSAEAAPFAKVGGLADVAGSLPIALQAAGAQPLLVMPRYGSIDPARFGLRWDDRSVTVPWGIDGHAHGHGHGHGHSHMRTERFGLAWTTLAGSVPVLMLENPRLFGSSDVYREDVDRERFFLFSRAALDALRLVGFRPEVVHANDWHTGMALVWHNQARRNDPWWRGQGSVLTIHNLAHQGITDVPYARWLGYEAGRLLAVETARYPNTINVLARAIVSADVITTVSPTYAREIQTESLGAGLDPLLRQRSDALVGILNGIDLTSYDPATDTRIPAQYSAGDLAGKAVCKQRLQEFARLEIKADIPLIGVVSRLDDQKGFDLVAESLDRIIGLGAQFVLLGTGDPRYHAAFDGLAQRYPRRAASILAFDSTLAQLIYAGSDLFLMPSRFEPCGLGQMIAMRYGSVPVVRATGGLADTVTEWDPSTGQGTGFVFSDYHSNDLIDAVARGLRVYRRPDEWLQLVGNAMRFDASWAHSANEYLAVYDLALARAGTTHERGTNAP